MKILPATNITSPYTFLAKIRDGIATLETDQGEKWQSSSDQPAAELEDFLLLSLAHYLKIEDTNSPAPLPYDIKERLKLEIGNKGLGECPPSETLDLEFIDTIVNYAAMPSDWHSARLPRFVKNIGGGVHKCRNVVIA